jgi:Immunity protein 10
LTGAVESPILATMSASGPSKITAQMVSVWRDDSLAGVALAERDDSSGWNLVFERALAFTDADRRAGQDTYCITNEAGVAVYGGVTSWAVAGKDLTLALAEKTAADLGVAQQLTIELAFAPASIEQLDTALAEILAPNR